VLSNFLWSFCRGPLKFGAPRHWTP
jgi:hypothetical protein